MEYGLDIRLLCDNDILPHRTKRRRRTRTGASRPTRDLLLLLENLFRVLCGMVVREGCQKVVVGGGTHANTHFGFSLMDPSRLKIHQGLSRRCDLVGPGWVLLCMSCSLFQKKDPPCVYCEVEQRVKSNRNDNHFLQMLSRW